MSLREEMRAHRDTMVKKLQAAGAKVKMGHEVGELPAGSQTKATEPCSTPEEAIGALLGLCSGASLVLSPNISCVGEPGSLRYVAECVVA